MTFSEFQATRQRIGAREAEAEGYQVIEPQTEEVLMYEGGLVIEPTRNWPVKPDGAYHLSLERDSYLSDDLAQLEHRLYDWGCRAGNLSAAGTEQKIWTGQSGGWEPLLETLEALERDLEEMPPEKRNTAHFARLELANTIARAREILEALANDEEHNP